MKESNSFTENLSGHLFWDVDSCSLNPDVHAAFIIQRVLQYGHIEDWFCIQKYYGLEKIGKIASEEIRDLDDKSLSFVAFITKIPQEQFLCFTLKQSRPKHWDF